MSSRDEVPISDVKRFLRTLPRSARRDLCADATAGGVGCTALAVFACFPVIGMLAGGAIAAAAGLGPIVAFIGAALGLVMGVLVGVMLLRFIDLWCVRSYLRTRCPGGRLPRCPACGYDQRGTPEPRCPECGCPIGIA